MIPSKLTAALRNFAEAAGRAQGLLLLETLIARAELAYERKHSADLEALNERLAARLGEMVLAKHEGGVRR